MQNAKSQTNIDEILLQMCAHTLLSEEKRKDIKKLAREIFGKEKIGYLMYNTLQNLAGDNWLYLPGYGWNQNFMKILDHNRLNRLSQHLHLLEEIVFIAKSELGEKFFRDHLIHMLRVMLLSHALALKLKLDEKKLTACTIAGLFHDIGYPIKELPSIIKILCEEISALLPLINVDMNINLKVNYSKLEEIYKDKIQISVLKNIEKSHATLGAIEFLSFWDFTRIDSEVAEIIFEAARAIANHDYEAGDKVFYSKDPVTTVLIIADEMQDWDRCIGITGKLVSGTTELTIDGGQINVTIDYSKVPEGFSPLSQIYGKQRNLSRVLLDGGFPSLRLCYKLPEYECIHFESIISAAKNIIECFQKLAELYPCSYLIWGNRCWWDESPYYWLYANLENSLNNFQRKEHEFNLFLNTNSRELVVAKLINFPKEIVAVNRNGKITWNHNVFMLKEPIKLIRRAGAPALENDFLVFSAVEFSINCVEKTADEFYVSLKTGGNEITCTEYFIFMLQLIYLVCLMIVEAIQKLFHWKHNVNIPELNSLWELVRSKELVEITNAISLTLNDKGRFFFLK